MSYNSLSYCAYGSDSHAPAPMTPIRHLTIALVTALSSTAFAESAQAVPGVAPLPRPQVSMTPMGMGGGPHVSTEIHLVTLDASGSLDATSQKLIDDLTQVGWKPMGMSTVSPSPVTLAIMFSKMALQQRTVLPPRPSQPLPVAPAPASMPSAPAAPIPAAPAPGIPTPAVQPKP